MRYCEEWIERKLRDRLNLYKRRYPMFDVERVMQTVETWDEKSQRWSPYMDDKDIRGINKRYHRAQSIRSLCENEHI